MPALIASSQQRIVLKTDAFSCWFEPATGFLREVRSSGSEVIRAIYGAVRDREWNTIPPFISLTEHVQETDRFLIRISARSDQGEIQFAWETTMRGEGRQLEVIFEGEALSAFYRNRIGLCVLHPLKECVAKPCVVRHPDGTTQDGAFPSLIAPHQPFTDIRGLRWTPSKGIDVELAFEGEAFEMEDQRNWSDASFKTYSTPLKIPFPVRVAADTKVRHRITLNLQGKVTGAISPQQEPIRIVPGKTVSRLLPRIGVGFSECILSERTADLLRALKLPHLRVELDLSSPHWLSRWESSVGHAQAIDTRIEPALIVSDPAQINAFLMDAVAYRSHHAPTISLLHRDGGTTPPLWVSSLNEQLSAVGIAATVVGGVDSNFTELNRNRPQHGGAACFSMNPQVHASDDFSVMQNLEAQSDIVESAVVFAKSGVVIAPITLRPRAPQQPDSGDPIAVLTHSPDPRQRTSFCAAWTLGSLARLLSTDGIRSLTYFETVGPSGLVDEQGEAFPVYQLFAHLADAEAVIDITNSEPENVAALLLHLKSGKRRLLLANLTDVERTAAWTNDEQPIALAPYALVSVDPGA